MDDFKKEHALETFRSLITIAVAALQTLVLLNGGALVALLAYLGQIDNRAEHASHVATPAMFLIAGLVFAALAFVATYLTQLRLYGESVLGEKRSHKVPLWVAGISAACSLTAFSIGAYFGADALTASSPMIIGIP